MKRFLSIFCALTLCLGLALSPASAMAEDEVLKTVTLAESWAFSGFYTVVTPAQGNNFGFSYWSRNCYDTLVRFGQDGSLEGALAESWDISEDGLMYTFTLREGIKFSDGTALTADAVKQSMEAAIVNLDMYNGSYGRVSSLIASMDAPDDKTFVMTLNHPYYAALNDLTMCNPLAIVAPAAFEGGYENAYANCGQATMGTGPYMYSGMENGDYVFVRNPHYWGEAPDLDEFRVKVIEDNDAKVLALRSGEIDAILNSENLSYDAFTELSHDPHFGTAVQEHGMLTRYLALNLTTAPFNDPLVRKAVSYAIDRDVLCNVVLSGIDTPADRLVDVTKPYCDFDVETYAFDLEAANALMDEAGWIDSDGDGVREKDGQKLALTFHYSHSLGSIDDMVLAICDQLSKIGFKLTPSSTDMITWYGILYTDEFSISYYYTYGGAYDPATVLSNMNPSVSSDPVIVQSTALIDNGVALVEELDSTADLARVQEIYEILLGEIARQATVVPLAYARQIAVWSSDKIDAYDFCYDNRYITMSELKIK